MNVFLGQPTESEKLWILANRVPAARAVTRIWWSNNESDYSDCPSNNGTFDDSCIPEEKNTYEIMKVEFGSDVTSIGNSAFSDSGLTSVAIPNSVTSIGQQAFFACYYLASITIPDTVESIGNDAFGTDSDSSLNSVTIIGNGGNANNVKQMILDAGVFDFDQSITWNMPETN